MPTVNNILCRRSCCLTLICLLPGFEVLKWMRNHPDFTRTPVVVFSSSTREDDRVKARELGANEFVAKPKSGKEFGRVVEGLQERWLGGWGERLKAEG